MMLSSLALAVIIINRLSVDMSKLQDAGLTGKHSTCERSIASCSYLGFVSRYGRCRPEDSKVGAIKALPVPHTKAHRILP